MWRGGTEQNLRFGGSVTEAGNELRGQHPPADTERNEISNLAEAERKRGGTAHLGGHETEQFFKVGVSVAEWPSSVDTEREGFTEAWRNAILSCPVPYKTKMDPTLSRPARSQGRKNGDFTLIVLVCNGT